MNAPACGAPPLGRGCAGIGYPFTATLPDSHRRRRSRVGGEHLESATRHYLDPFSVPASTPLELVDNDDLDAIEEEFRAGVMSLGWDPTTAQIVIEAYPLEEVAEDDDGFLEEDDDNTDPAEVLRVRMPVGTAQAFAKRTREVVGAGRPICVICGQPIDADGHTCTFPKA